MEYISKSDLIAEIERRKKEYDTSQHYSDDDFSHFFTLDEIQSFIDSMKVEEVDLNNSMVCSVDWYDGFLLDYTQEQQDELLIRMGADVGDKIKVILIKE